MASKTEQPAFVGRAIKRERSAPARGWAEVYFRLSRIERAHFEAFLVATAHPSAFRAGTEEQRFREYVQTAARLPAGE